MVIDSVAKEIAMKKLIYLVMINFNYGHLTTSTFIKTN